MIKQRDRAVTPNIIFEWNETQKNDQLYIYVYIYICVACRPVAK
jgi:hypothetical protein